MRIQCQFDIVAGAASETAKILFSYYFLSIISAPMILCMVCAALALIINGMRRSLDKENIDFNAINVELAIYRGSDILLFFLAIYNVDPTTFVVVQLVAITAANAMQYQMVDKKVLWLSLVASILFLRAKSSISLLDVTSAAISSIVRLETQRISSQHTKMIVMQADIVSDTALCLILWLVIPVERNLFMIAVPDPKLLISIGSLACLAFIYNREASSATKQSTTVTASLICGLAAAILTSSGIHLLIVFIAIILIAMAAYNRMDEEPLIDQHYNDIITPRIIQQHNKYSHQKLTGVILVTFVLFLAHFQSQTIAEIHEQTTKLQPTIEIPLIDFNDRSLNDGVRKQIRQQCLHKTRALYIDQVVSTIKPNAPIAIVHYPDHWNLGDAFIYHGQTTLWHVYGQLIQRPPAIKNNFDVFTQIMKGEINVRGGVLFMTGGGNVGDTYPEADMDRWQLIGAIGYDNIYSLRLVMLPQSIHYKSPVRLDLAKIGYRHQNLTMMLRDGESLQFAQKNFITEQSVYVPDAAFMLGPMLPNADPVVDLFFLIRQDTESAISNKQPILGLAKKLGLTAEVWDFPILGFPESKISDEIISNITKVYPNRYLYPGRDKSIEAQVAYRTQLGNSMMSRGRVIISDRLHASIMATLIDRPVVYIDNNYRKSSRVRSSLTEHIPECTDTVLNAYYAPNIEAAVEIAATIISKLKN